MSVETEFSRAFLKIVARAKREERYEPPRLRELIAQHGAVGAAKELLGFGAVHEAFTVMWDRNRPDLTVELLALQPEWAGLFTESELRTARRRLVDYGYPAMKLPPPPPPPPPPEPVRRSMGASPEGEPPSITRSEKAAEPVGAYAHARRVGGLLFLAGVGPRRRGSKEIPGVTLGPDGKVVTYEIEAQIHACFENVRTILEESGSSWAKIVDVQVFLTDMKRDFAIYNRVYAEYFPPGPNQPCRTTVEIGALPMAGNAPINFEVKVIATV